MPSQELAYETKGPKNSETKKIKMYNLIFIVLNRKQKSIYPLIFTEATETLLMTAAV